jgi:hypothetical protein
MNVVAAAGVVPNVRAALYPVPNLYTGESKAAASMSAKGLALGVS